MTDTATPERGPVDAPASIESIANEIAADMEAGGESPDGAVEAVTQELVNEAEGKGDAAEAPTTEDDATDPAEPAEEVETAAEEPEEEQPDEQTYTVKVNGEERTVPLSELLNGYSRTEDYKAKTAAVAEERRQVEALKANLEPELKAQFANQLEEATNLFVQEDQVLQDLQKVNWAQLKATDPAAYVQLKDIWDAKVQTIEGMKERVATARQEAQQQQQARAEQERQARFDAAAEKIVEANPDLADEAKFSAFASEAIGFLREEGFGPEEIAEVLDHRVLQLAADARAWRAHKAAQKQLPQKKIVPKSAVKPLTTDGAGSRASAPRVPASRDGKVNWVVNQLLSEE